MVAVDIPADYAARRPRGSLRALAVFFYHSGMKLFGRGRLLIGVSTLAIVALIGWSGLFSEDGGPPTSAAASTATVATVEGEAQKTGSGEPAAKAG